MRLPFKVITDMNKYVEGYIRALEVHSTNVDLTDELDDWVYCKDYPDYCINIWENDITKKIYASVYREYAGVIETDDWVRIYP